MLKPRMAAIAALAVALVLPVAAALAATSIPPGPPFPEPDVDRAVYDQAQVFRPDTIATLEAGIDAIEARTGAEMVVYTQVWPIKIDQPSSEANAAALMDQWGIGRRGFDDGLVIMFDLDPSLVHGQVSLFAGSGFGSTFLTDAERQQIFDVDMVPRLAAGDLDGAALVALQRVDAAATPEHARRLELARQVNAVVGILGGAVALIGLAGWALFHWLRYGRDPVYVNAESVLIPAPPAGMTAATGTLVLDGATSRRSLTTALLDLASRGEVAFREERGFLGLGAGKVSIDVGSRAAEAALVALAAEDGLARRPSDASGSGGAASPGVPFPVDSTSAADQDLAVARSRLALANRRPLSAAEDYLLGRLGSLAEDDTVDPDRVAGIAADVPTFEGTLEDVAVKQGWFTRRPSTVVGRWRGLGLGEMLAGGFAVVVGVIIPASGLVVVGIAAIVAGVVTFLLAPAMPARTMAGAMQRAWLHAYRRTLSRTMEQARSMDQVVRESGFDWLQTPDQAIVWSVALGLAGQVEDVLKRTMADAEATGTRAGFMPVWYRSDDGTGFAAGGSGGGGLFSSSGVPDLGGMLSTLGTIGSTPSSSSGGGGGGFGGGSSGGGGGAGGGF
ncbi:MAG: TPM domain-containing protein [Chloroflexota bacterium]